MKARVVKCEAQRLRKAFGTRTCNLDMNRYLNQKVTGAIGPSGFSDVAADLLDVAAAVYRCERLLPSAGSTNRYTHFNLSMPLRMPDAWTGNASIYLADILEFLGDAKWGFKFSKAAAPVPRCKISTEANNKEHVVLFSGGMDSTCGLASYMRDASTMLLSSYYTRQKTIQQDIATDLDYGNHVQWSLTGLNGPGRSFFYRSFYFLSLAAALADSWKIRQLTQFENGILAYAIPPSPWYAMTKHAHPRFLLLAAQLYEELFGSGAWVIENPFINLTKRQEVNTVVQRLGAKQANRLFSKTETCWSHWACHVHGLEKKPGEPCGVCIPCIIRRTALPFEHFRVDLTKRANQNDEKMGQAFRSYLAFVNSIAACKSAESFYLLLPSHVRHTVSYPDELNALFRLFRLFGREFLDTFFP